MTRRRRVSIAIVALAGVLVTVGLGAQKPQRCLYITRDQKEYCKMNLAYVVEWAARSCEGIADEYVDTCEAGLVLDYCPDEVTCTPPDPIWCAPCTDMHGAPFWRNMRLAERNCRNKHGLYKYGLDERMFTEVFAACVDADVKQHCPELSSDGGRFAWWLNTYYWKE